MAARGRRWHSRHEQAVADPRPPLARLHSRPRRRRLPPVVAAGGRYPVESHLRTGRMASPLAVGSVKEDPGMTDLSATVATSWEFEEGTEIAPGRSVLKRFHANSELYDTYLVWDERHFAVMVAKLIRPDRVGDNRARRGLKREAVALRRLEHPVVVRAFDAVHTGPNPHVLLEHLEGFTLRAVVRREGPLPLEQCLPLALHIASALHYFAREEYVHLDVKPDNLIMGLPPRLIDLSLARSVRDCRAIKGLVGTDAYMAPEQCTPGQGPLIGPPADVWGLAATLYYACAGTVPFPRPPREARDTLADRVRQLR